MTEGLLKHAMWTRAALSGADGQVAAHSASAESLGCTLLAECSISSRYAEGHWGSDKQALSMERMVKKSGSGEGRMLQAVSRTAMRYECRVSDAWQVQWLVA